MSFHEIRFPTNLSFGSAGGPERRTDIVTLANGYEERNTPWSHSRRRFDAGLGMRSLNDLEILLAFFESRRGQLHAFRLKDWMDYKSCPIAREVAQDDQVIGLGDGIVSSFQLIKTYLSGVNSYVRPISKPVAGSVLVGVDGANLIEGVDFDVDATTGILTLSEAPATDAVITAGFQFDVPVRFDTDLIQTSIASFNAGSVPNVPIVEVRI